MGTGFESDSAASVPTVGGPIVIAAGVVALTVEGGSGGVVVGADAATVGTAGVVAGPAVVGELVATVDVGTAAGDGGGVVASTAGTVGGGVPISGRTNRS